MEGIKRIYVVGVGARSFEWTAPAGGTREVWVINRGGMMFPVHTYDRWFHLHGPDHIRQKDGEVCLTIMRDVGVESKVLAPESVLPYVPNAIPFPYAEVKRFARSEYFNNSFPLLIVYAVMCGAMEIVLDGVQYGQDSPAEQWAVRCIEHWIGWAHGVGVRVQVPKGSGLLMHTHMYGLEGPGSV